MPGYPQPRQSAIIVRLSGANVERTGVFGGMSGSPVYIDGKLVGAIAFTFNFAKEPIAGITPIKQMIDIFERGAARQSGDGGPFGFLRARRPFVRASVWTEGGDSATVTAATFIAR